MIAKKVMDMDMVVTLVVDTLHHVHNKGTDIQQEDINSLSMVTLNFNRTLMMKLLWGGIALFCIALSLCGGLRCGALVL